MHHIQDTIQLAMRGWGAVSPNPLVGAVVVRDGKVVGTGFHAQYGGPHAEAVALREAGEYAVGATLYCNLEPCSYTAPDKHQPACTHQIVDAGVGHVVIGQLDPNPNVRGRGVQQLRDAGITVTCVDDGERYWRFNDAFNTWMAIKRPFVHLKAAMTLDGKIADERGGSRWITDESARAQAHAFRGQRDGIVVGIETLISDDPLLTTRLATGRDPRPIVLDSTLRIPLESQLVRRRAADLLVFCSTEEDAAESEKRRALEQIGVTVCPVPRDAGYGGLDLASVLVELTRLQITSIFVEGGSSVLTSFVHAGLYDRLTIFVAPIVLGAGRPVFGDIGASEIADAIRLDGVAWKQIGAQQVVDGYRPTWLSEVHESVVKNEQRSTASMAGTIAGPIEAPKPAQEIFHVYGNR